jgi:hypothetical protein
MIRRKRTSGESIVEKTVEEKRKKKKGKEDSN